MTKLHQLLAVSTGVKTSTKHTVDQGYHALQRGPDFTGHARRYTPRAEDGVELPPDDKNVLSSAPGLLNQIQTALTRLIDVQASVDATNQVAKADVRINGQVLAEQVPVPTLIFLGKLLADLHSVISKAPTLDPAVSWSWDPNRGLFVSAPVVQVRNEKVQVPLVKYEATDKHPAQVDVISKDIPVGDWTTIKFSGAMPKDTVTELVKRIDQLREAVTLAREEANTAEVVDRSVGQALLDYALAPVH